MATFCTEIGALDEGVGISRRAPRGLLARLRVHAVARVVTGVGAGADGACVLKQGAARGRKSIALSLTLPQGRAPTPARFVTTLTVTPISLLAHHRSLTPNSLLAHHHSVSHPTVS